MPKEKEKEPIIHIIVFMSIASIVIILIYSALNQMFKTSFIVTISLLIFIIYLAFLINKKLILTPTDKAKNIFSMNRLSSHHYDDQVAHLKKLVDNRNEYQSNVEDEIKREGFVNENNR